MAAQVTNKESRKPPDADKTRPSILGSGIPGRLDIFSVESAMPSSMLALACVDDKCLDAATGAFDEQKCNFKYRVHWDSLLDVAAVTETSQNVHIG